MIFIHHLLINNNNNKQGWRQTQHMGDISKHKSLTKQIEQKCSVSLPVTCYFIFTVWGWSKEQVWLTALTHTAPPQTTLKYITATLNEKKTTKDKRDIRKSSPIVEGERKESHHSLQNDCDWFTSLISSKSYHKLQVLFHQLSIFTSILITGCTLSLSFY